MAIYLGFPNTEGKAVSREVQDLGLNLLRAPPSRINVAVSTQLEQPGYGSYVLNLSAFMLATHLQKEVRLEGNHMVPPIGPENYLPLPLPTLCVSYSKNPSAATIATLTEIGFERTELRGRTPVYLVYVKTVEDVKKVMGTQPLEATQAPANTVNVHAMKMYLGVVKIFSLFLRTHGYPAYRTEEHLQEIVYLREAAKRAALDNIDPTPTKKQRISEQGDSQASTVEDEEEEVEVSSELLVNTYVHLRKAKPTRDHTIPWGTLDRVPDVSGLYFAFVEPLASPDKETVPYVASQYFLKSFGSDSKTQLNMSGEIRKAWGIVCSTLSGSCLAHIAKVIDIALRAQATVFPIFQNGVYEGSVLCGSGYQLRVGDSIWKPLSATDLKKVICDSSLQEKAIRNISDIVGEDVSHVTSMRGLHRFLVERLLSVDERDRILSNAKMLRLNQTYWAVNATTVCNMINALLDTDKDEDKLDAFPLHPSALFSTDWTTLVLASFGYEAPSPNIPCSQKVYIKSSSKAPQCLAMKSVSLVDAVREWKQLPETKFCTNNPTNLSKRFQCRSFSGKEKAMIWDAMKTYCNAGQGHTTPDDQDEGKVDEEVASAFDL